MIANLLPVLTRVAGDYWKESLLAWPFSCTLKP